MRSRPEVVVVSPFGTLGGAERWLLDVVDHLPDRSLRVIVLQEGPLVPALRDRGVDVEVVPTAPSATGVLRTAGRLVRRLRSPRPDVVLANGVKAAAAAVPAARLLGVPTVWAKHDFARDRVLARPLGRMADVVVAASAAVGAATGRDDVVVAPPTATVEPVDRLSARDELRRRGVPVSDGLLVGMVTRLVAMKGVDDAIRALTRAQAANWHLVVMGPDDPSAPGERDRLVALAATLGVADRVHLLGWVPRAPRWLAGLDAVAVLTRTDPRGFGREGFGLAALEGLRAGVPVVGVADSPEVARLATRGGRVVPPGDPAAVAEALAGLRSDGPAPGPHLAALVADHPSPEEVAGRVTLALDRAIGAGASR